MSLQPEQLLNPVEFLSLFPGLHTFVAKNEKEHEVPSHFCKKDILDIGQYLMSLNKQGNGIYFTVNEIDQDLDIGLNATGFPKKRTKKMVKTIRAVFCDDDQTLAYRDDFPLMPNITLRSSANKFQYFWLTTTDDFKEWEEVQQTIVDKYAGDNQAKDLARVLRIPGFFHNKAEPFLIKAILNRVEPYSWHETTEAFPPTKWKPMFQKNEAGNPVLLNPQYEAFHSNALLEQLREGVHIHGPCSRVAQSYANFGKDKGYICRVIWPSLAESKASDPEHPNHSEWRKKMEGGLDHDITTAINKFTGERLLA